MCIYVHTRKYIHTHIYNMCVHIYTRTNKTIKLNLKVQMIDPQIAMCKNMGQ